MGFAAVLLLLACGDVHAVDSGAQTTSQSVTSGGPRAVNLRLSTGVRTAQTVPDMPGLYRPAVVVFSAERTSGSPWSTERLSSAETVPSQVANRVGVTIREKPLNTLTTDIVPPPGELPDDSAVARFGAHPGSMPGGACSREWTPGVYCWEAPCLCHYPLYFEDINLERHGHRAQYIQPIVSAAHFFGRIPAIPYMMALEPPWDQQYALGHTRPGSAECYPIRLVPVSIGSSAVETAVIAALILAIP